VIGAADKLGDLEFSASINNATIRNAVLKVGGHQPTSFHLASLCW
jgi:hypothetical protein